MPHSIGKLNSLHFECKFSDVQKMNIQVSDTNGQLSHKLNGPYTHTHPNPRLRDSWLSGNSPRHPSVFTFFLSLLFFPFHLGFNFWKCCSCKQQNASRMVRPGHKMQTPVHQATVSVHLSQTVVASWILITSDWLQTRLTLCGLTPHPST